MGGSALNNGEHREIFRWMISLLIMIFSVAGCANDTTLKKDPFFEKWKTLEQTSAGSSPVVSPRVTDVRDIVSKSGTDTFGEKPIASVRLLPTNEISLKMRQADVKSVLRSLALAVNLNILIKNDIKGEVSVDFKAVPWDQAFSSILRTYGLTYVWEGDIILRVLSLDDMERDLKQKTQELGSRWVEPLLTVVVPIDYAIEAVADDSKKESRGKVLTENLESLLTRTKEDKPRGSVRVDLQSNSLIISAIKEDLLKILSIIEKIDKPMPQIQIKANIVETTKTMARSLGIQWGGVFGRSVGNNSLYVTPGGSSGSTSSTGSALSGSYTPSSGSSTGISGQGYGVNFPASGLTSTASSSLGLIFGTIGGNVLELQLSALQKDSKLNILSSPSITTMDNQMAFTENGTRVPYVTTESSGGTTTRTVKFEDAVLRLEITPHVIDGKNMKMKIVVKKDEVDTTNNVDGNPYIIKKKTETSLIVQDGETIVISGLTKQTNTTGNSGVPFFKDVPILGWLFKSDSKEEGMEEVLIFITPTILPPQPAVASKSLTDKPVEKGK